MAGVVGAGIERAATDAPVDALPDPRQQSSVKW
jgi:hypothetical protein